MTEKVTRREFFGLLPRLINRASGVIFPLSIGFSAAMIVDSSPLTFDRLDPASIVEADPLMIDQHIVNFVGVRHEPETYEKHKDKIEQAIVSSDVVVLEYVEESFLSLADPNMSEEDIKSRLYQTRTASIIGNELMDTSLFYLLVARLCALHEKPILLMNPDNILGRLSEFITNGIMPAIVAHKGYDAVQRKVERREKKISNSRVEMIRRDFLKVMGLFGSWAMLSNLGFTSAIRGAVLNGRTEEGMADAAGNSYIDFRDVTVADFLLSWLEKNNRQELSVTLIQGLAHNAVREYLANPNLVKLKKQQYALQYGKISDRSIREYQYMPTGWQKREIPVE